MGIRQTFSIVLSGGTISPASVSVVAPTDLFVRGITLSSTGESNTPLSVSLNPTAQALPGILAMSVGSSTGVDAQNSSSSLNAFVKSGEVIYLHGYGGYAFAGAVLTCEQS